MLKSLQPGDRVRAASGGPVMDVLSIAGDRAECLHFVGGEPLIASHPLGALKSADVESIVCVDPERGEFVVVTADAEGKRDERPLREFLERIRRSFEMDVVFVSQFQDGRRIIRQVAADPGDEYAVPVGASDPLEESYCQRVVDGRLPELIEDAAANPETARLAGTAAFKVGCYLSTPIVSDDGVVFGTLCCFSHDARHDVASRAKLGSLKSIAALLADSLSARRQEHKHTS